MREPDVARWSPDQRISSTRMFEVRAESINQRDRARRQRRSAISMREEAREIRERTWRDWTHRP